MPNPTVVSLVTKAPDGTGSLITDVEIVEFLREGKLSDRMIRLHLDCGCRPYLGLPLTEQPPAVGERHACLSMAHR